MPPAKCANLAGVMWQNLPDHYPTGHEQTMQRLTALRASFSGISRSGRIFLSHTVHPESPQLQEIARLLTIAGYQVVNPVQSRRLAETKGQWEDLRDEIHSSDYIMVFADCWSGRGQRTESIPDGKCSIPDENCILGSEAGQAEFDVRTICQWEFKTAWDNYLENRSPRFLNFLVPQEDGMRVRPLPSDPSVEKGSELTPSVLCGHFENHLEDQKKFIHALQKLSAPSAAQWNEDLVQNALDSLLNEEERRSRSLFVRLPVQFLSTWREFHDSLPHFTMT